MTTSTTPRPHSRSTGITDPWLVIDLRDTDQLGASPSVFADLDKPIRRAALHAQMRLDASY